MVNKGTNSMIAGSYRIEAGKITFRDYANAGVIMDSKIYQANQYSGGCVIVDYKDVKLLLPKNKLASFKNIPENLDIGALKSLCRNNFGQLITSEMYNKLEEVAKKYDQGQFKIDTIKYEKVSEYIRKHVEASSILRQESRKQDILEIASYKKTPKFLQVEHAEEEEHEKINPEMPVKTCEELDRLLFENYQKPGTLEAGKKMKSLKGSLSVLLRDLLQNKYRDANGGILLDCLLSVN